VKIALGPLANGDVVLVLNWADDLKHLMEKR
jgi:hypothetical protein